MNLFLLEAGETLWWDTTTAKVVAKDEDAARACMTCGSDSLWVSVSSCKDLGPYEGEIPPNCYSSAGGYVL